MASFRGFLGTILNHRVVKGPGGVQGEGVPQSSRMESLGSPGFHPLPLNTPGP